MSDFNGFEGQSFLTGILASPWTESILNCKKIRKLNANHRPNDMINGSFRITTKFRDPKSWYDCGLEIALPEIIGHYLHLNLSFVRPNNNFDGTMGTVNGTHTTGPMKMILNNQVDYVIDNIFMTEDLWLPEFINMTNALKENYGISFLMKKQATRISIANYLNVFNLFIWMLLFVSIFVIGTVHGVILKVRKYNGNNIKELAFHLVYNYFNLFMSKQSSKFLTKLKPRHYLMYLIPLLSIIVINSMAYSIYSNMISPPKQWCKSIDCFAKSNYKFYALDQQPSYKLLKSKNQWQLNSIISKTKLYHES